MRNAAVHVSRCIYVLYEQKELKTKLENWRLEMARRRRNPALVWFEERALAQREQQAREEAERVAQEAADQVLQRRQRIELVRRLKKFEAKVAVRRRYDAEVRKLAEQKTQQLATMVSLFQEWTAENHELKLQATAKAEADEVIAREEQRKQEAQERRELLEKQTAEERGAEKLLNQQVLSIMRQSGVCYAPARSPRAAEEQPETSLNIVVSRKPNMQTSDKAQALTLDLRR